MPIINAKLSGPPTRELIPALSEALLDITERILRKNRSVTAITFDFVPHEHWVIAGSTLAEQRKNSFYFDIKVVEGTNTKDEMAAYAAAAFRVFERLLGDLHEESYVYVQEVRAHSYGYGGLTQEFRYVKGKLEG